MKINNVKKIESSFLSVEKDLQLIIDKILDNKRLQRLLLCTTRDALTNINYEITDEDAIKMFGKNIKITPKLHIDSEVLNYLFIRFNNFAPNETNPEFRNNIISFDIMCHHDQWQLDGIKLRPYAIAAELDSMFNNCKLSGIGYLEFMGASFFNENEEFSGISLIYAAVHGYEDKNAMLAQGTLAEQIGFSNQFYDVYGGE